MSIHYSDDSDITYWPLSDLHDRQSSKYYFIDYRPETWGPNKVYIKNVDLVIPPTENGCMYECISGGTSSPAQPSFTTKEGGVVDDSDVRWRALPFSARLGYSDTIVVSTWSATTGVVIEDDEIISGRSTAIRVVSIPVDACTFDLVNTIQVNRGSGRIEVFKKTLRITVGIL